MATTFVESKARRATVPWQAHVPWFLAALLLTLAYQAVYCHAVTRDDWTGLFFSGAKYHRPTEAVGYVYPGTGFDGQFYRLIAHDPLAAKGYWKDLDAPRYRACRGLVPLLAALAGAGSPQATDFAYILLVDLALAFGAICFVRLAEGYCRTGAALALYLAIPAIVTSTDRMVLDGLVVVGFLAAWLFFRDRRTGALLAVLAMATLLKETGLCLAAGVGMACLYRRQYRHAALTALTPVPALCWWWFVVGRTPPAPSDGYNNLSIPVIPHILRLFSVARPVDSPLGLLLATLDLAAWICLLIALAYFAKAAWDAMRARHWEQDILIVLPFAVLTAFTGSKAILADSYSTMRVNGPLLAWAAVRMMRVRPIYAIIWVSASSAALLVFRASPVLRFLGITKL